MANEQPLAFRIKSLNNQIKRMLEKSAIRDNDAGLTGMQYGFLGYLGEKDPGADVYQRDIEAEFNIRRSTATGMLQLLEKKGYIRRESVPGDARLKKIILTDKALELHHFAQANLVKLEERLTRGISDEEMAQFCQTLQKISNNTRE
ncbi:MarR family transcriptional regulator [Clostridia bacterium OttesenSCG-928-O13]|nr:MarR family transcriptional regulator [Clostridia bacterium OttesenSCG-928-O13]